MIYILDTNAVSLLLKGTAATADHLAAARRNDVLLPQPVIAEISYGLMRMPKSARQRRLSERFKALRSELCRATWTDEVSDAFGAIKTQLERRGEPLEDFDLAIAAHALALDATLVTDNERHFKRVRYLKTASWRS